MLFFHHTIEIFFNEVLEYFSVQYLKIPIFNLLPCIVFRYPKHTEFFHG